ncbi:MAG: MBL fold metallo-hydrolase [Anaeromyxobacter sp.]
MPSPFGARAQGARLERMRASPRFRDGVFHNTAPVGAALPAGQALPVLGEFVFGDAQRSPPAPLPGDDPRPAWLTPPGSGLRVTWLGHSTLLLELDGFRLLTDPVWGERASPWRFAGPRRFQPAPVSIDALPALDAVLLSHDHYDHLDLPTIQALARRPVTFVTALGVGAHLEAWGVPPARILELDWWEDAPLHGGALRVTAAPAQHFSGRGLRDRNATLWCSFAVATARHRVYFGGDTGPTPEHAEVGARLGPFDLAMLEVGAHHPAWGAIHLGPERALEAQARLGGPPLLPIHWGTFNLALHAWDEPVESLLAGAARSGARLLLPRLGQAVEPAAAGLPEPWWRAAAQPVEAWRAAHGRAVSGVKP